MIAVARRIAAAGRVVRPRRDLAVPHRRRRRAPAGLCGCAITVLSVVLVWGVLVAPDRLFQLTPAAFARIPVEGLALVAVALVLPPGRDGSWPRSLESCSACSLSSRSSTWRSTRRSGGRSTRCSTGATRPGCWRGPRRDRRHAHRTSRSSRSRSVVILLVGAITACSDSHHRRGRPAPPRHGSRTRRPHSRSGRCARACHCNSSPGSPVASTSAAGLAVAQVRDTQTALRDQQPFRAGPPQPRPRSQHPRLGPAHRIARQGRHHRLRRELRAGRRPGHELLARHRRRPAPDTAVAGPRRLVRAERLAHLPDLRRHQLARPLHPAVGAVGRHPTALCRAGRQPPVHPQRRLQQGRLAHRQRRPADDGDWPPGT